jgi:hypothetical protein
MPVGSVRQVDDAEGIHSWIVIRVSWSAAAL